MADMGARARGQRDMTTDDDQQQPAPGEDEQQPAPGEDEQQPAPDEDEQQPAPDEDEDEDSTDADTFPRAYVSRLRARSAGYRTRANEAEARTEALEGALFTERVRALDVLADPSDMPFSAELLEDPDALRDAVAALVNKSPHYRRRGTATGTGAHDSSTPPRAPVSLLGMMRHGV